MEEVVLDYSVDEPVPRCEEETLGVEGVQAGAPPPLPVETGEGPPQDVPVQRTPLPEDDGAEPPAKRPALSRAAAVGASGPRPRGMFGAMLGHLRAAAAAAPPPRALAPASPALDTGAAAASRQQPATSSAPPSRRGGNASGATGGAGRSSGGSGAALSLRGGQPRRPSPPPPPQCLLTTAPGVPQLWWRPGNPAADPHFAEDLAAQRTQLAARGSVQR